MALKGIQVSVWGAVNVLHWPQVAVLGKGEGELCQDNRGTALTPAISEHSKEARGGRVGWGKAGAERGCT